MFELEKDDILVKVHPYRLRRSDGTIHIDVLEAISRNVDVRFIAVPMDHPYTFFHAPKKFYGKGDTEHEALKNCIAAISGVSKSEIFPTSEKE